MDFIESKLLGIKENLIDNESHEKAIGHINELFYKYPTNAEIFHLLGMEYQEVNKHELAIECFTKAKKINPEINRFNLSLKYSANLLIKNEGLEKLNQYDIDEKTLYEIRAKYYHDSELFEQAIAEYKKSIEVNPTWWPAYIFIAEIYQKTGDAEKAFSFYDKALSSGSIEFEGIIKILFERSRLYIKYNNFKNASITLHSLLEITVEDIENHLYSLDFIHDHDEYDELIEICEQQIAGNPKDIYAILSKGIMFLLKKELVEAKYNFSTAISLAPKNPGTHFCSGITFYLLGEPENAIKSVLSACALDFTNNYYNTFYQYLIKRKFR